MLYAKVTVFLRQNPGTFSVQRRKNLQKQVFVFSAAGAPLRQFPDMIVNSAHAFIPISDLSVTAKTGDISGDSSSRGQDSENRDPTLVTLLYAGHDSAYLSTLS